MDEVSRVLGDILGVCMPEKVILFAEKRTMSTRKLKSLSLCVIVGENENPRALRTRMHLAVSVDVPVTLCVYTTEQWEELLEDESSYAAWIARKGQVLYGPKT